DGTDFSSRDDLSQLWELWEVRWSPDFDATCIEAARYGTTLGDAVSACLTESLSPAQRDAEQAASVLLQAALAGVQTVTGDLINQLEVLIAQDGEFHSVTAALRHLLFLYCYDEALGTAGSDRCGFLLGETFTRAVWLLESLGEVEGREREFLKGLSGVVETIDRAGLLLDLNRDELIDVLSRVSQDVDQSPTVRGAVAGALWTLGESDGDHIATVLALFAQPAELGDFLTGLFCLGREVAQRNPSLVQSIDQLLMSFRGEDFLEALPAMRLAFTFFTPREKHHMLNTLFESLGLRERPLTALEVDAETAAEALALESRVFEIVERYGLRGSEE
ncbi:MAG: hypothetical protein KDA84_10755, partial [Planctomycetaceae bacterium]|nr:hypothetical protein [Planctomycetaceae bacterium]